jgi:hypothetical protein
MLRTRRTKILALMLLAGGLAAGALVWRANTRTITGTTGGGDVYTHGKDAATCGAHARTFNDYPLVWAGDSVLGYPLTWCDHMMTKTRRAPDGRVSHPGGDAWHFVYGTCTIPEGKESCGDPITITIDPCAFLVDGRIIPWPGRPTRSMTVRGAQALIGEHGISFEQSPQFISIDATGTGGPDEITANAIAVAEALVPANGLAEALSRGAPLTAAFMATPDAFCTGSSGPATTPSPR